MSQGDIDKALEQGAAIFCPVCGTCRTRTPSLTMTTCTGCHTTLRMVAGLFAERVSPLELGVREVAHGLKRAPR